MIVTIDDYRGAAAANAGPGHNEPPKGGDFKFTVARAGHLKFQLQALNIALTRTPFNQHSQLQFDDILQGASPRTYVNGSEEVYFLTKSLPWPSKIPEVFAEAYSQVLQLRPFTNTYIVRDFTQVTPEFFSSASARFAPIFSKIRPLLPELDMLCDTTLNTFFQKADEKGMSSSRSFSQVTDHITVKPFAFMQLPTELRLQVYDYLVPTRAFVHLYSKEFPMLDRNPPSCLEIMRVNKQLHEETTKHFFDKPTLLIEACKESRLHQTQGFFTKHTTGEYVALVTSMSPEVKRRFTRLELRIFPDCASTADKAQLGPLPLRQICNALPNLESILISYSKINERATSRRVRVRQLRFHEERKSTLEWLRAQLPDNALQVAWDLTNFQRPVEDAAEFREAVMSERMMRELVERDGSLNLAQSAAATQDSLQRWSEMKEIVHQAVGRN